MRQLFVPACLCLMTWSSAPSSDSGLSLDEFYGAGNRDRNIVAAPTGPAHAATDTVIVKIPIDPTATELAIEIPAVEPQSAMSERIPLPPIAKPVVERSVEEVCDSLTEAAQNNDLPVPFFIRLLFQESGFDPAIVSSAGAQGIAQFMPDTAADIGLKNPFDPLQAIPASARLLRNLVTQFGNLGLAAAAYNAGPKRIQDWLDKNGDKNGDKSRDKNAAKTADKKPKLPEETQDYVRIITGRPVETWTEASAAHPGLRLPRHAPCQEAAGLYAWAGPETIPLPPPSPLAHHVASAVRSQPVVASLQTTQAVNGTRQKPHHEQRVAATIEFVNAAKSLPAKSLPAKTLAAKSLAPAAAQAASQQLAARQHNIDQHKLEKVAQQ